MDVTVDLTKCQSYAQCVLEAPEVFELGPDNKARVLAGSVTPGNEKFILAAADLCPMQAILVAE